MKNFLTIPLLLLFCTLGFGQTDSDTQDDDFVQAEFLGEYENGLHALLRKNITYPEIAKENNISGEVKVFFQIDTLGNVINLEIVGQRLGFGLDEEAIKVIRLTSGKWKPATQKGKPIISQMVVPIVFGLEKPENNNTRKNKRKK